MKRKNTMRKAVGFAMILAMSTSSVLSVGASAADGKFYPDYSSQEENLAAGAELVEEISADGMVLLKNEDNALPLGESGVSVFGVHSEDFYYVGGGSAGGNNDADYNVKLTTALRESGFSVNPTLEQFYVNKDATGLYSGTVSEEGAENYGQSKEVPISEYPAGLADTYGNYDDAALVVISRTGSEGSDVYAGKVDENGNKVQKHYLELTDDEENLIQYIKDSGTFKKIVVLVNSGTPMELGTLQDDPDIDGILWVGMPGSTGLRAAAEILKGSVNPSGKLADIYARDFTQDPTYQNFGSNSQNGSGYQYSYDDNLLSYVEYEEGIYVGYRYYETRAHDYTDDPDWYAKNVVYPFGYGLSYTDFSWEITNVTGLDGATGDEEITVEVAVTNTGDVAGKDVVELYYEAPYYTGGIEKSSAVLGAFAKTDEIQPGETQNVTLTMKASDMASYDDERENTEFTGYVLEHGTYTLRLQKDSHNVVTEVGSYELADDVQFEGNEALFSNDDKYDSTGNGMEEMTRADFTNAEIASFPDAPTQEELNISSDSWIAETEEQLKFTASSEDAEAGEDWYEEYKEIPEEWTQGSEITVKFSDLIGKDKDDPMWTEFLNELTYDQMLEFVKAQSYDSTAVDELGIPRILTGDGPNQLSNWNVSGMGGDYAGTEWPCANLVAATWNTDLALEHGEMVGNDAFWIGVQGWYAPATDMHRSQFAGRNFEYYSEDGLLAGKICASIINGCQSKGTICYLKHFGANEQELDRDGLITWATEQSLREVYFKSFQIATEEGNPYGYMSAMNRIGMVGNSVNYRLLTSLLRDEWGFEGYVVSDMCLGYTAGKSTNNADMFTRAGMDAVLTVSGMPGMDPVAPTGEWDASARDGKGSVVIDGAVNNITYHAVRNSVHNILYAVLQSAVTKNNVDLSGYTGGQLTDGALAAAYDGSVALGEGTGATTVAYALADGSKLPAGLALNSANGAISGTAMEAGNFSFEVEATVDGYVKTTTAYTVNITNGETFTAELPAGTAGAEYSAAIEQNGLDISEAAYKVTDGALPAGLVLNADGTITGTPESAGEYSFTVQADVLQNTTTMFYLEPNYEPMSYVMQYTITVA